MGKRTCAMEDMAMMQDVCICIPTKNRPKMVDEILNYTRSYYTDYNFQIIYFDSSDDDKTQCVINQHKSAGFHNLSYKWMDSSWCLDRKVFELLSQDKDVRNASYVWLINDSIAIRQESLETIVEAIQMGYDLIRLPAAGEGSKQDVVCTDIDEWFHRCSKGMAHMASTVMSTSLLHADPDWDLLYQKYIVTDTIGDGYHEYFFTVGLYLEQIAKLTHFSGIMLGKHRQWRRDSPLKRGRSYWNDFPFEVWAKSYCETILKLPECYTNKVNVIRRSDNIVYGRFERRSMLSYRHRGLLTEETVRQYAKYWSMVSTLSYQEILEIAAKPVMELSYDCFDCSDWERNVVRLEERLAGRTLIIFGAGLYGGYVLKKLLQDGFAEAVVGVAVSDPSVNLDLLEGYPVQAIGTFISLKNDVAVIISTLPDVAVKIDDMLKQMGFQHRYMLF